MGQARSLMPVIHFNGTYARHATNLPAAAWERVSGAWKLMLLLRFMLIRVHCAPVVGYPINDSSTVDRHRL